MFTSICWTSFSLPESLVHVGAEALCMSCNHILSFRDLTTGNYTYFKTEGHAVADICCLAGHARLPFVAFAENIVNSSIHVIKYPELLKYTTFTNDNVLSFIDLKFNEYDLLIGLTGLPNYTIYIWNYRTGQKILEHDTNIECFPYALNISPLHSPQILQYSDWHKQIVLWEILITDTTAELYQVYKKQLRKEDNLPRSTFNFSYSDDNILYYVDNMGTFFSIEISQYYLNSLWHIPDDDIDEDYKLRHYELCSHKQGFLISSKHVLYCIQKKPTSWQTEWKINIEAKLCRLISTNKGEMFASDLRGNLWHLEYPELKLIDDYNRRIINFVILRGAKEDCIIQLSDECELRVLMLPNRCVLSTRKIPGATMLCTFAFQPMLIVGTSNGTLHIYNYDKPTEPIELAVIESEDGYPWQIMAHSDTLCGMVDTNYNCYVFQTDLANDIFKQICYIDKIPNTYYVLDLVITNDMVVYIFLASRDENLIYPYANLLWVYNCQPDEKRAICRRLALPYKYRTICKIPASVTKAGEEFAGARVRSTIIDIIQYRYDIEQLTVLQTIRTNHVSSITEIAVTRNITSCSMNSIYLHYRLHKKTSKIYAISQCLEVRHNLNPVKKFRECFNGKYFIVLYENGVMIATVINPTSAIHENSFLREEEIVKKVQNVATLELTGTDRDTIIQYTHEQLKSRDQLVKLVEDISKEVTALIDYDINVAGKNDKMFRKFCLNHVWLKELTAEAEKLCQAERSSLTATIDDQLRIRQWMYNVITKGSMSIIYRLRTLYADFAVDNYGIRKKDDIYEMKYNLFRFYDMDPLELETDEVMPNEDELKNLEDEAFEELAPVKIQRKYFVIQGNAYDHVMSNELAMQEIKQNTAYDMFNQWSKYKILLGDVLKVEFNKMFDEARKLKCDLIESILKINSTIVKIHGNMNCMLKLLNLATFVPPPLSIPEWQKDEIIERIMEVDDSEIMAINRRKVKVEEVAKKQGRLLLWSIEFWVRALQVMMDGVLEKLWEEEIKKDIPLPEFMIKKQPVEYTLEDQKLLRAYEEQVNLLTEDRKKYLRILTENEIKAKHQKDNFIVQINQKITELMIMKLKYDYAIRHVNLRNKNTIVMHLNRLKVLKKINQLRKDVTDISKLILKCTQFQEQFNKPIEDYRAKLEAFTTKERTIDRQFKNQFLNSIPQQLTGEMNRVYKRRPKFPQKLMGNCMICNELSSKILDKVHIRDAFPMPKECTEYLDTLRIMDDFNNMPSAMDIKQWEQFIKLRRQKIEAEFKIKALNLQLADANALIHNSLKDFQALKDLKDNTEYKLEHYEMKYVDIVQDQVLELRLTMGQVENNIIHDLSNFTNCILMHEDDVQVINNIILKSGEMKLKAMERVAIFRRQVIYKEWEHKMICANISYLKYILNAICKCKVSIEFLNIIRNWEKTKANKEHMLNSVGLIEKVCADKVITFRKNLQDILNRLAKVREKIDEKKRNNRYINRQMEEMNVSVTLLNVKRDDLIEEKRHREQKERMAKIIKRAHLLETVRKDYVKILELKTLLELQRLRTYPTLGPNPNQHC